MKYLKSYLGNTTQHNTTQHNTTQHNTTQHNTTQHNTTQHNTTQRDNYYQGLRGIAILAVLLIHTLGITKNDSLVVIGRQFINYAVPLFLFLAGFFCRKQFDYGKFNYKKSLIKVLIPYFIWSFILLLKVKFYNFNLKEILISLLIAKHFGIYYYIILLSQLILLSPLLLKKKFNIYILMITPISVLIYYYLRIRGYDVVFPFNVLFIWSGITFYYLGMYFDEILKKIKDCNLKIIFIFIIIFNILETIYFFKDKKIFDLAISQFKLSSLMITFCLILLIIKDKKLKNILENKFIVYLGDNSFGIYLVHAIFITIITKILGIFINNPYIVFLIVTLLALVFSLLLLYLVKKILKEKSKYLGI